MRCTLFTHPVDDSGRLCKILSFSTVGIGTRCVGILALGALVLAEDTQVRWLDHNCRGVHGCDASVLGCIDVDSVVAVGVARGPDEDDAPSHHEYIAHYSMVGWFLRLALLD